MNSKYQGSTTTYPGRSAEIATPSSRIGWWLWKWRHHSRLVVPLVRLVDECSWWFWYKWPFLPIWYINWSEDRLDQLMYKRLDDYKACRYLVEQAIREGGSVGQAHRITVGGSQFWDITIRPAKHEDVYNGSSLSSFCSWEL